MLSALTNELHRWVTRLTPPPKLDLLASLFPDAHAPRDAIRARMLYLEDYRYGKKAEVRFARELDGDSGPTGREPQHLGHGRHHSVWAERDLDRFVREHVEAYLQRVEAGLHHDDRALQATFGIKPSVAATEGEDPDERATSTGSHASQLTTSKRTDTRVPAKNPSDARDPTAWRKEAGH